MSGAWRTEAASRAWEPVASGSPGLGALALVERHSLGLRLSPMSQAPPAPTALSLYRPLAPSHRKQADGRRPPACAKYPPPLRWPSREGPRSPTPKAGWAQLQRRCDRRLETLSQLQG